MVGTADLKGNTARHAFLYSNGQMQDLGTLDILSSDNSVAWSVNAAGQVVGWSDYGGASGALTFIYEDGKMTNLATLLDNSGAGWTLGGNEPISINNNGWIAATAIDSLGNTRAVLLTPTITPEPSTLTLAGLALIAHLFVRRHFRMSPNAGTWFRVPTTQL